MAPRRSCGVALLVLTSGCERTNPVIGPPLVKPDLARLATMTLEQKCDAVAPRAAPCTDEIMLAELRFIGMADDALESVASDFAKQKVTAAKQREVHHATCLAVDRHAEDVVACWDTPSCRAFAGCLMKQRPRKTTPGPVVGPPPKRPQNIPAVMPDLTKLATLTPEQKCDTVAPRAAQCIDEMVLTEMRALGLDESVVKDTAADFRSKQSSEAELYKAHAVACLGNDRHAEHVIACWTMPDCQAFADCVVARRPNP